mgnify:CR=1 FL=1
MNARLCFSVLCLAAVATAFAAPDPSRWDKAHGFFKPNNDESKVEPYTLEDPCAFADGTKLKSAAEWPKRRAEILGIFAKEMFGEELPKPEALVCDLVSEKTTAAGYATRRFFRMYFKADRTGPCVEWALWLPRHAKGKVPVVLGLTYRGIHELVPDPDIPVCRGWSRNETQYGIIDHRATEDEISAEEDNQEVRMRAFRFCVNRFFSNRREKNGQYGTDPACGRRIDSKYLIRRLLQAGI